MSYIILWASGVSFDYYTIYMSLIKTIFMFKQRNKGQQLPTLIYVSGKTTGQRTIIIKFPYQPIN